MYNKIQCQTQTKFPDKAKQQLQKTTKRDMNVKSNWQPDPGTLNIATVQNVKT